MSTETKQLLSSEPEKLEATFPIYKHEHAFILREVIATCDHFRVCMDVGGRALIFEDGSGASYLLDVQDFANAVFDQLVEPGNDTSEEQ